MKKYIFTIMFFLGCFFLSLSPQLVNAEASTSATVTADAYNKKIITVKLQDIHSSIKSIKVYEIRYCEESETPGDGCNDYSIGFAAAQKSYKFELLDSGIVYTLTPDEGGNTDSNYYNATIIYNVNSDSDGKKDFYVEALTKTDKNDAFSCVFSYELSTLNQRVVINSDAQGNPTHVYDHIQYSPSRVLNITIDFTDVEISEKYSGEVYFFEDGVTKYSYWEADRDGFNFGLESYGDGLKKIDIYLLKKNQTIDLNADVKNQLKSKAELISKEIYLDTIGPIITIPGGQWVLVKAGDKYKAQDATCKDAVFTEDECVVINDANIIDLDYSSSKHQLITYEATDRLGNVRTLHVNVKIEQKKDNSGVVATWVTIGCVLAITVTVLGYILIRNNEKKKKISYI